MKNLTICIRLAIFLLACTSGPLIAAPQTLQRDSIQTMASAKVLLARMDIINALDKKDLRASEVRKLKRELRGIKSELKELEGGRFIPVGTLILLLLVPFVVFNVTH